MNMLRQMTLTLVLGGICLVALALIVNAKDEPKADTPQQPADIVIGQHSSEVPVYAPSSFWIGIRVVPVPDVLLSHFGGEEDGAGLVVIEDVIKDGPADKAGLKRGDVILRLGDKEVHRLSDLVGRLDEVKDTPQKIAFVRKGETSELDVTPEKRPYEAMAMAGPPGFRGLPQNMPMLRPPGMKMGPEIWLGNRDPQQMMKEMEEYFRQMQGGVDGEQFLLLPDKDAVPDATAIDGNAKRLEISSKTDQDGKTTIHVKQVLRSGDKTEEKTWEADSVDALPDEIRDQVKAMFGK